MSKLYGNDTYNIRCEKCHKMLVKFPGGQKCETPGCETYLEWL